jgi:hypothetical protein
MASQRILTRAVPDFLDAAAAAAAAFLWALACASAAIRSFLFARNQKEKKRESHEHTFGAMRKKKRKIPSFSAFSSSFLALRFSSSSFLFFFFSSLSCTVGVKWRRSEYHQVSGKGHISGHLRELYRCCGSYLSFGLGYVVLLLPASLFLLLLFG